MAAGNAKAPDREAEGLGYDELGAGLLVWSRAIAYSIHPFTAARYSPSAPIR